MILSMCAYMFSHTLLFDSDSCLMFFLPKKLCATPPPLLFMAVFSSNLTSPSPYLSGSILGLLV